VGRERAYRGGGRLGGGATSIQLSSKRFGLFADLTLEECGLGHRRRHRMLFLAVRKTSAGSMLTWIRDPEFNEWRGAAA
jgi:hypothetical protein